jgi:hypothetical protein
MSRLTNARYICVVVVLTLMSVVAVAQRAAALRGQVTDQLGGAIVGAHVDLVDQDGKNHSTRTDDRGIFIFGALPEGTYRLKASNSGFNTYEQSDIALRSGKMEIVDVKLTVTIKESVTVGGELSVTTDPGNNQGAVVIKGKDLDALPDDPDELSSALRSLAGPAAGPGGAQIYLDGFSAGEFGNEQNIPTRQAIREVVINRNPFSAENDRIGFGRIDVFTRPGMGTIHGGGSFFFSNRNLDSRNPYALNHPEYLARYFDANLSGPLISKRISYFASIIRRDTDDNAIINAVTLDNNFRQQPIAEALVTPKRFFEITPRFDIQLNKSNSLTMRYTRDTAGKDNQGIGGLYLRSRGYNYTASDQVIQGTEVSIISPRIVNETRVQYRWYERRDTANETSPAVDVIGSLAGGGSSTGNVFHSASGIEIHNYTTVTSGRHTFRFGGRFRAIHVIDSSPTDFNGTFFFAGIRAPELDAGNNVVLGSDGQPVFINITSLENYRRNLLFRSLGVPAAQIRLLGGGAAALSLSVGNPSGSVHQVDAGIFVQDDWKVRPGLTLSLGLRYENQTNLSSNLNFAPRVAFAWVPWAKGGGQPKTVIRGGSGVFFDRVIHNLILNVNRLNGINERNYLVSSENNLLDLFPAVPTAAMLAAVNVPQTVQTLAPTLTAPYVIQSSLSIEHSFARNITVSASFINSHGLHQLMSRNINAPVPGTGKLDGNGDEAVGGVRPYGNNNIDEYESAGVYNQNLLVINSAIRPSPKVSFFATYTFGKAYSNTDGANHFPASSYDLSTEYGRASYDIRHRFTMGGTIDIPWGITLNPLVVASTGLPFNVTSGIDFNGDGQFNDRPAFADNLKEASVIITSLGAFNVAPGLHDKIIPRNYGQGPGYIGFNLRVTKTFVLLGERKGVAAGNKSGGAHPLKLACSMYAVNVLNHVNPGPPIGTLSSPLFGTSDQLAFQYGLIGTNPASNRTVFLQVRLTF